MEVSFEWREKTRKTKNLSNKTPPPIQIQRQSRDRQTDSTKENENVRDKVTRSGQARSIRNRNILQNSGSAALAQQQSVIQVSLRACLVQFSVREGDSDN